MIRTFHRLLVALVLLPVVFYRRVLSPMKRVPSCIYLPTCSEFAIQAVQKRGIVLGSALALARILRCNPLFHGGFHPVSDAVSARRCAHHPVQGASRTESVSIRGLRPADRNRSHVLGAVEEQH